MKKSTFFNIVFLFFLPLLSACSSHEPTVYIHTNDNICNITVEIANNDEDRARGLMGRESVPENTGMLFSYSEDVRPNFWMKNMKIPIDIIFITSDGVIDTIHHNALPCLSDESCAYYRSKGEVRYVLEVSAGYTEKQGIRTGDQITFDNFLP